MAYTSGTATNYKDLLATLATFAAANGWTLLEQTPSLLYLRGEGTQGLDEIYVGIEAFENTSAGYYNWRLAGSWGHRDGRAFGKHPITSPLRYAYLWNAPIPYWMVATPRRIIVVAKISTVYQTIYLGFGSPPATDAQYPYPLIIGGCGDTAGQSYSVTGPGNSAFWANIGPAGALCTPGGDWRVIGPQIDQYTERCPVLSVGFEQRANILTGPGGTYALEAMYVTDALRVATHCALDGLYRVSGYNNSAENIITIGSVNYLAVPDVYRSSYGDYCAMRLN